MSLRQSIWSEFVEPERLARRETLSLLASRSIRLLWAVVPEWVDEAPRVISACRDAGVSIGVWPMIEDQKGRWANGWNAEVFAEYGRRLLETLDRHQALPDELILDLEPPIAALRRAVHMRPTRFRGGRRGEALVRLSDEWRAAGVPVSAAVLPVAAAGIGRRGWQRLLGTPLDGLGASKVNAMVYTTIFEGYSRGLLRRGDAESLLYSCASAVREHYGDAGSISLGLVGIGALGDEAIYRSVDELARDVAIARAAGINDLALYDLSGILARPPAEAWLDSLCGLAAAPQVLETQRGQWSWRAMQWMGTLLAALPSMSRRPMTDNR